MKNFSEESKAINRFFYEELAYSKGANFVAGIDEAGRGPLAGPIFAAAVIFPRQAEEILELSLLDDSKKLSPKKRKALIPFIEETALAYGIAFVTAKEINEIGITKANNKVMKLALENAKISLNKKYKQAKIDFVLSDFVHLDGLDEDIKQINITKGDALSVSIMAASILAKEARDEYMAKVDELYPEYGFIKHKGYGTKGHKETLVKFGPCEEHREQFVKTFLKDK